MRRFCLFIVATLMIASFARAQEKSEPKSSNLRQWYSGKFGFYNPSDGLNNGLMFGIDGITEFVHYDFFLSGAIELYPKQTISIFTDPKPQVTQQQIVLLPLHINFGYKFFDVENADSRGYVGLGAGYYFYFYNVDYQSGTGGIFGGLTSQSASNNGGNVFGTIFARFLIGRIFVEPRLYFASKEEETVEGGYKYQVNPSGFAITLGFQYR